MAGRANSRRTFLCVLLAMIPGLLFAGPRELRAARRGARDLVDRLEMEGLASSRPRRESGFSTGKTGDQTTLYREGTPLCRLNRTGQMVWELCDGRHRPGEMSRSVVQQCPIGAAGAEGDVFLFLAELRKIGAIRV